MLVIETVREHLISISESPMYAYVNLYVLITRIQFNFGCWKYSSCWMFVKNYSHQIIVQYDDFHFYQVTSIVLFQIEPYTDYKIKYSREWLR